MSDTPRSYDCKQCIALGKQNKVRGRECLLNRDYSRSPVPFAARVRGSPWLKGKVSSEDELFEVIDKLLELYSTDELSVALRRLGKGICPKSFPISRQSHYFLELFRLTHGGEYGLELINLPVAGAILDQPAMFYIASDVISSVKSRNISEKLEDAGKDKGDGSRISPTSGQRSDNPSSKIGGARFTPE